jgi:glucose-6-phosphate 1-dehydrogenase
MTHGEQTLLILGASGDLTARLLLPGLGGLLASGVGAGLSLVGSGREQWDDAQWRERVAESFAGAGVAGDAIDRVAREARYLAADVTSEDDLKRLLDDCRGTALIYFALPPSITERACQALTRIDTPDDMRLVMEKPFGTDAASAQALNEVLAQLVPEDQVHRVDHFLGMATVINVIGVRFANRIFEPVLTSEHVASVDIVFDEVLGLEGRAGYYDNAGAMVDMIQSHLLQVLSVVAMEQPPTLGAGDLRDARAQVLRATRVYRGDPVASSFRGRYTAGEIDGRRLPSYADEDGVDPARQTETLAAVVVEVGTWRWAGVPFRLRSGKALGAPREEVQINFKHPQRVPTGLTGHDQPDRLRMGLRREGDSMDLRLNISGPGDPWEIDHVTMRADFGAGALHEYGEVLKGVIEDDPTLSVRGDMAVDCWRVIEPVQRAWRAGEVPLEEYPAGSGGPEGWPV